MMSWKHSWTVVPLALALAGCPKDEPAEAVVESTNADTVTAEGPAPGSEVERAPHKETSPMPSMPKPEPLAGASDQHFAMRLLHAMPDEGNVVLGPSSITLALGLLGAGAVGDTEALMRTELGLHPKVSWHHANSKRVYSWESSEDFTLAVANRVYASEGLQVKSNYQEITSKDYGASLERVNFASDEARQTINGWVKTETRDMIPELLAPGSVDAGTSSVLVNAVYLNAPWGTAFDPAQTSDQPFTLADGSKVSVPLMYQQSDDVRMGTHDGATLAAVPYAGGSLQMLLFLPDDSSGMPALEASLAETGLDPWLATLTPGKTRLYVPRFKVREQVSLQPVLTELGLGSIFGGGDFSGISDAGLTVDKVIHEAVVDVTEEGTEAAAATAVVMTRSARPADMPRIFRADRPFLFAIYDPATKSVLFTGRYAQPE